MNEKQLSAFMSSLSIFGLYACGITIGGFIQENYSCYLNNFDSIEPCGTSWEEPNYIILFVCIIIAVACLNVIKITVEDIKTWNMK